MLGPEARATSYTVTSFKAFILRGERLSHWSDMDRQPYQTAINALAKRAIADVMRHRGPGETVMLVLLTPEEGKRAGIEAIKGEAS